MIFSLLSITRAYLSDYWYLEKSQALKGASPLGETILC